MTGTVFLMIKIPVHKPGKEMNFVAAMLNVYVNQSSVGLAVVLFVQEAQGFVSCTVKG